MTRDPIQPLGEAIKDLMDERPRSCAYYHSWEYQANRTESSKLDHKMRKILGKKTMKKIWNLYSRIDQLDGELQAGIQDSCYELGFNDALQLANQIDETGKGHRTIFN